MAPEHFDVEELSRRGDIDGLIAALERGEPGERIGAADHLGRLGDERAIPALVRAHRADPYWESDETASGAYTMVWSVRASAEQALRQIGGPEAEHALHVHDVERRAALSRVREAKGQRDLRVLTNELTHEHEQVRRESEEALRTLGDPAAIDELVPLLQHERDEVVMSAARVLNSLGNVEGAAVIFLDAARTDWTLRDKIARRLKKAGEPAVLLLKPGLHDENEAVRRSVAELLGEIGGEPAVEQLAVLLEDEDEGVREAATIALERVGSG